MRFEYSFMLILIGLIVVLAGCTASYEKSTDSFSMPPALKDYDVYRLDSTGGSSLYVLVKKDGEDRPAIGTTQPGKTSYHTIVIDGEAYGKLEK